MKKFAIMSGLMFFVLSASAECILTSFTATGGYGEIAISWTTANEVDNDHFELLRNSQVVVQISSQGDGGTYAWVDRNMPLDTLMVYSLVCVNVNGEREDLGSVSAMAQHWVELAQFNVVSECPLRIDWTTSSEVQNAMFEIWRDGTRADTVSAANAPHTYAWQDINATIGLVHNYELYAITTDGARGLIAGGTGVSFANVDLGTYQAIPGDNSVRLDWTTASECNNNFFDIRRFGTTIALVPTQGNGPVGHSYSWVDNSVQNGSLYTYSLWTVNIFGIHDSLSSLQAMPLTANDQASPIISHDWLSAYPNPFNSQTTLHFTLLRDESTQITLYDLTGRLVGQFADRVMSSGMHALTIDGTTLPSSTYVVVISTPTVHRSEKLLLLR